MSATGCLHRKKQTNLSSGNLRKLCFQTLVIMADFNCPYNCWKSKARITEIKQSRLLQSCDENFLMPKNGPEAEEGRYSNKLHTFQRASQEYEGLGCSKHRVVEFRLFRGEREIAGSQTRTWHEQTWLAQLE